MFFHAPEEEKSMAQLSPIRTAVPLLDGLILLYRGKVRDTYEIDAERMLMVATDGISIFDFVLNALVPEKGMILTAMSHFWFNRVAEYGVRTHVIAAGAGIDVFLPVPLRGNTDLQSRAMVVRRMRMHPVEFVARAYLTGSALAEYRKTGTMCGHQLPKGLQDGDELPVIFDTPTTKSDNGHDEALNYAVVSKEYTQETLLLLDIFAVMSTFANERGIIMADSKMEFGQHNGFPVLGDEVGTPDSSRFWNKVEWREGRKIAEGRIAPPPFDKQLVRAWGIEQGINTLDPRNSDDLARVHGLRVPQDLIRATTHTYRYIFWRLFGTRVEEYLNRELNVALPTKKKRVAIVFGSESDIKPVLPILRLFQSGGSARGILGHPSIHVISCHRNPMMLDLFVQSGCEGADVIVAAGGKAFALPGVLDALLYAKFKDISVVGVALGNPGTRALDAAKLSIEELPGQPVIMDEVNGTAYAGNEGMLAALIRISSGELPPAKPRAHKIAKFNIDLAAL